MSSFMLSSISFSKVWIILKSRLKTFESTITYTVLFFYNSSLPFIISSYTVSINFVINLIKSFTSWIAWLEFVWRSYLSSFGKVVNWKDVAPSYVSLRPKIILFFCLHSYMSFWYFCLKSLLNFRITRLMKLFWQIICLLIKLKADILFESFSYL